MGPRIAIVTGAAGGIGQATCDAIQRAGYRPFGLDRVAPPKGVCDQFFPVDLAKIGADDTACEAVLSDIRAAAGEAPIGLLVNNAAVQVLGRTLEISPADWLQTLYVNLSAPFMLSRGLSGDLARSNGVIVNVGSVHAQATKPGFAAYATSKAALHGLTHALAVDLAPAVRVVTIAPAAIGTDMLRAGFVGNAEAFEALEGTHPLERIGTPREIGEAIAWLASPGAAFMTGSTVWMDGGVLSRLHDPV